jgi:hypothetical protein
VTLSVLCPTDFPEWDSLTATLSGHSIFHEGSSIVAFPLVIARRGPAARRGVCLSFSDMCPPLCSDSRHLQPALALFRDWARRRNLSSVELRGGDLEGLGVGVRARYVEHVLDLSKDIDRIWRGLRGSTQRNVRKAERADLRVTVRKDATAVDVYYRMHCATRRRLGVPPQPRRFFRCIHEHLISRGNGIVVLAQERGVPIAASMYLHAGESAVYKFGASVRERQELRANNLVMWAAIKWYADRGFRRLSFGRTDLNDLGLLQFKDGWGAIRRPLVYWGGLGADPSPSAAPRRSGAAREVVRTVARLLPVPALRAIGEVLYPYLA